jgi:hypothetical protein
MQSAIKSFTLLIFVSAVICVQAATTDIWSAGHCVGAVAGGLQYLGMKLPDFSPKVINIVQRFNPTLQATAPTTQLCINNSATVNQLESCLKSKIPQKDNYEFASGYINGMGYAKVNGVTQTKIDADLICGLVK